MPVAPPVVYAAPGPYYYGYGYRPYYGYRRGYATATATALCDGLSPQPPAEMTTMRLTITALVCVLGTILAPRSAAALDFPTRPVHVIVPFTAGGAPDVLMRLLGQKLAEKWGQGRCDREPRRR